MGPHPTPFAPSAVAATERALPPAARAALHAAAIRADRLVAVALLAHFAFALAIAPIHGTWTAALGIGGSALAAYLVVARALPGATATRWLAGLALQAFCALHIHQMRGLAEMHFFFFTSVTVMIAYKDPVALWPGVLAIILQHTLFSWWHNADVHPGGTQFFTDERVSAAKLVFHFGIAAAQAAAASWVATLLRRQTIAMAAQETALRDARDVADAASAAKTEFLARMNHELRTPLTAILGFTRVVLHQKHGPLPGPAIVPLERVVVNSEHLLALINDTVDLSRIEAGRMHYDLGPVDLPRLVSEVIATLEGHAEAKGITLRADFPEWCAPVWGDVLRLKQVVLNLVANAVKFTREGEVVVRVHAEPRTGDVLALEVADTGPGIAADRLDAIFEAFTQAERSTARTHGGSGLGLAISQRLCDGLGARLSVRSTVGVGSTFRIDFAGPAVDGRTGVRAA